MLLKKKDDKKKEEKKESSILGYEHYKRYLYVLMERLVQAYQVMPLAWWHALISFIGGTFFGMVIGFVALNLLFPQPPKIENLVIPINETHIIRIRVPNS